MRILIVGNSQVSCLRTAWGQQPGLARGHEIHFYVFPGGWGPSFDIVDGRLRIQTDKVNEKFPPRAFPGQAAEMQVGEYDLIAVSALGWVDGGFLYKSPALLAGQVYRFGPRPNDIVSRLISAGCARSAVDALLAGQPGFKFLDELRRAYAGPIVVQPFPRLSSAVADHPDWVPNRLYEDPLAAHRFFSDARWGYLERTCARLSATLLPYPPIATVDGLFTPSDEMLDGDATHPGARYGAAVLQQIVDAADAAAQP